VGPLTTAQMWLAQTLPGVDGDTDEGSATEDVEVPQIPGQETTRTFTEYVAEQMPNDVLVSLVEATLGPVLQILLILVIASVVLRFARRVISRGVLRAKDPEAPQGPLRRKRSAASQEPGYALRRAQRADALGALLTSVATVVVWVLAAFLVLAEVGVNLAPLVAGAGVVGLAIGFGAQDLVNDFISGVFMLAEDQFGVGDIVDVGEASGVVEGVTLRTTKIRDVEGTLWHVPNGEIRRVGNSSQQWARSLLDIGVAYDTDVDMAIDVIEAVAGAMAEEEGYRDQFLDAPDVWGVQSLGADSVDIRLVIKTEPGKQWAISRELRRRLKSAFDATGIEIPYQQRTVWVRDETTYEPPAPLDEAAIQRAISSARSGDRGAEKVLAQDENVVAADVEEELAEEAGATPSDDQPPR
jgi:moderate conductance mechanosensitive channel